MLRLLPRFLWLALLAASIAQAQNGRRFTPVSEPRIALVIGNTNYPTCALTNPVNDAHDMAAALKRYGFRVIELEDGKKNTMLAAIHRFGEQLGPETVALFYYSGHGAQAHGANYLIPVDFNGSKENDLETHGVNAGLVLAEMDRSRSRLNIVILDACRNNPFTTSSDRSLPGAGRPISRDLKGLAKMDAPKGTLIAYATAPGKVASDNPEGRNGLYTQELLRYMSVPGMEIGQVFKKVRSAVDAASHSRQVPWEEQSLENDFYFVEDGKPNPLPGPDRPHPADHGARPQNPAKGDAWENPKDGAKLIFVPGESGAGGWINATPITVRQFKRFCEEKHRPMPDAPTSSPNWDKPDAPMTNVSWKTAGEYCEWAGGKLPSAVLLEAVAQDDALTRALHLSQDLAEWTGDASGINATVIRIEGNELHRVRQRKTALDTGVGFRCLFAQ